MVPNYFRSAGVSPAGAWASCPRWRERDAPETAGKMPALHFEGTMRHSVEIV
jgi:hypothetical protein